MTDKLFQFSEIETFLEYYTPLTPYGLIDKKKGNIYDQKEILERLYDQIDLMIEFISTSSVKIDKIEYYLKRIPQLESSANRTIADSEIYNVKKFLINYREIFQLISETIRKSFGFLFHSDKLLILLSGDNPGDESFYLDASFSAELKELRVEINEIDDDLSNLKEKKIRHIKEILSFDFRFHDFLVVDESDIPDNSEQLIYIEPYDNRSVLIKPILGKEYYDIHSSRKELIEREKDIEGGIKEFLLSEINGERELIRQYEQNILILDRALTGAKLSLRFNSVRPEINNHQTISMKEAVYVPLQERIVKNKGIYSPLNADFDQKNIVVSGSNMGGKTVLLKTVLFCQLLAQRGLYVPADKFSTIIFQTINLIGNDLSDSSNGLSSFGEEIMNLVESENSENTLYIVDEFARTTNSTEGKALFCALLQWFGENSRVFSFSSTHQENLPALKNLSYWAMNGLDYDKYRKYYHKDYDCDLGDRISLINDFMDYGVSPLIKSGVKRDALKIADILGLNSKIINYAKKYIIKEQE